MNELPSVGSALLNFCKILIYLVRVAMHCVSTAVFQKLQALIIEFLEVLRY